MLTVRQNYFLLASSYRSLSLSNSITKTNTHRVREMYWSKTNFEAIENLKAAAEKYHNITLLEATLRWMRHHSGLTAKDGIILGASKVEQLEETLTALDQGPLGAEMIKAFDDAWEHCKGITEWYFHDPAPSVAEKEE